MKNLNPYFIIDFDSTFIKTEGLERLAEIALATSPIKSHILQELEKLTDLGMAGKISFRESLERRLELFAPTKEHLEQLIIELKQEITDSFATNKQFFKQNSERIYIISGGFKEWIIPVVEDFYIEADHVIANSFLTDKQGNITGFDQNNPLSDSQGKPKVVQNLSLRGKVYVIGDGYTDYEIKKNSKDYKFCVFTENKTRKEIIPLADYVLPNLNELLFILDLPRAVSYPKHRIKVLLLESIDPAAVNTFAQEGYTIEYIDHALSEVELIQKIPDINILGIRSKTIVTKNVLQHAKKLMVIGAFCVGTNQIDIEATTNQGITIFNAPFSNTRSVAELAIGQIIALNRGLVDKACKMKNGKWDKTLDNGYREIRGQKLGIIGYGNIGSQLSILAEALGMEVYYFDLQDKLALGNARHTKTLSELLEICDIVSLHVDGGKNNQHIIGKKEIDQMKPGAIFLNLTRGHVVDNDALYNAIKSKQLRGAALDVFENEPEAPKADFHCKLADLPNVILTPHIGANTIEAQEDIGNYVSGKIIKFINTGDTTMSKNIPQLRADKPEKLHRLIHIHKNVPGILARVNGILADHNVNIEYQRLDTNSQIGYLITDIAQDYNKEIISELKGIKNTINLRILF